MAQGCVLPIAVPQGDVGRLPQSGPLWPANSKGTLSGVPAKGTGQAVTSGL